MTNATADMAGFIDGVAALIPSDLGDLTVLEHLQRMAEDAARYHTVRQRVTVEVRDDVSDGYVVRFPRDNAYKGIWNPTFDSAVDAERAK